MIMAYPNDLLVQRTCPVESGFIQNAFRNLDAMMPGTLEVETMVFSLNLCYQQ